MPYDSYVTPEEYEVAKKNGISSKLVYSRVYQLGWDKKRAITEPPQPRNQHAKYLELAKKNGIHKQTYYSRVRLLGWNKEKAATEPPIKTPPIRRPKKYPEYAYENLKKNNIKKTTFYQRVHVLGWSIEDACTIPPKEKKNKNHIWRKRMV